MLPTHPWGTCFGHHGHGTQLSLGKTENQGIGEVIGNTRVGAITGGLGPTLTNNLKWLPPGAINNSKLHRLFSHLALGGTFSHNRWDRAGGKFSHISDTKMA